MKDFVDELINESVEDLEKASKRLSGLHEGIPLKWGNSETFFLQQEGLLPILENLNKVIQDLKKHL
jgi:hypothetical protein